MPEKSEKISYSFQIRILTVYFLLILLSFLGAVLAIRRVLLIRLDRRIEQALEQEVQELKVLVDGKDPDTAQPFDDNIKAIFNVFLRRNIPIIDEYTIALLPDGFYDSVPSRLPASIDANSEMVGYWQQLKITEKGEIEEAQNRIVYLAKPVRINGEIKGVFVVAIATHDQFQEVNEAILAIIRVTAIAVAITSTLAWIFTGRILSPLRSLTKTAQAIGENNLDRRIEISGNDEVALLSMTFNEMLDRLQSAFVNQQQFLSDVSHELKTPITIIQGHLEFMGTTPREQEETKELVFDELKRMNRLIGDLTLLAKSQQPNFLQMELVDLRILTQEIYYKCQGIAPRQWQLEAIAQGKILCDRQRVIQAITNLAQNATKYTKDEDTIAIGSATDDTKCYLWVRDMGTGIAKEDQELIFRRFQTGSNNRMGKSTGLGLSIVNAIAQAHRGKIKLSSYLGHGSKFTMVLPLNGT